MATPSPTATSSATTLNDQKLIEAALKTEGASTLNVVSNATAQAIQPKGSLTDLDEKKSLPKDADIAPPKSHPSLLALKYQICTPMLRYPLTLKKLHKVSTYLPIAINYFEIVHYMDELISCDTYFLRLGLPWHPLLSRLYFAELFYIQTLRAMRYARIGSSATKVFLEQFLKEYPPESLPVPGPLVPILQSISASQSENPLFGLICPAIPNSIGVDQASDLLFLNNQDFVLPNIPAIAGFLNTIINAEVNVPDYSDPETFDNNQNHILNGHIFEAEDWQLVDRLILLTPGLNCKIESTPEIDDNMHTRGKELDIPDIAANTDVKGIERFMLMEDNSTWFHNIIEVMSTYCSFFKESSTLGNCSPHGPTCGLLRSRLHNLTSRNAQNNIVNTLEHAFPGKYPFELIYEHRSFELSIPQNYSLIGQLSAINTSTSYRGLNTWNDINGLNTGRSGPYWTQNPSVSRTPEEDNLKEVENIIASHYFKTQS